MEKLLQVLQYYLPWENHKSNLKNPIPTSRVMISTLWIERSFGTNHYQTRRDFFFFFLSVSPHNLDHSVESHGWCDVVVIIGMWGPQFSGVITGPDWPKPQKPLDKECTQTVLDHWDLIQPHSPRLWGGEVRRLNTSTRRSIYRSQNGLEHNSFWDSSAKLQICD